ncbi:hypothetical protein KCU61_g8970, partial [Aureobasidium melanogenum]
MSSPSLPSLSSLHPVPRAQGFVTARSVLADLELQHDRSTDVIAPTEKPKRGRPKKAVGADDASTRPRARKTTTAIEDNSVLGDVAAKPKTRKREATTTNEEGAVVAPPPPKRGRPKKAIAIEDAAIASTDTVEATKPVAKRGRKKALEPTVNNDNDAAAERPKPQPKPRKTKAQSVEDTTATSDVLAVDNALDSGVPPVVPNEAPIEVLAPRRKRDWTPPTESFLPPSFQQSSDTSPNPESAAAHDHEGNEDTGDVPVASDFTRLMGDFAYQEDNARPAPSLSRTPSGGPTTKRKRLDPVAVTATEESKRRKKKVVEPKEPKEPKLKPPKKPKAPKKKPLTITALATAAYLPQSASTDVDQTKLISDFFPQPQPDAVALPEEAIVAKPTTSKKSVRAAEDKPAPKRKRTVKKVQITVPEIHVKLDSPEAARENAKRQQWLFGSSSQLAAAESPTELRDLQQAIKESEDMISSQQMDVSRATSCAHVPSAPHGTSLSIGQADRVLWMSAARDFEDSTFASDESRDNDNLVVVSESLRPQYPPSSANSAPDFRLTEVRPQVEVLTISSSAPKERESPDSGYVDVDQVGCASLSTSRLSERPTDLPLASSKTKAVASGVPKPLEIISLDTTPETEVLPRRALGARDPNSNITRQTFDVEDKDSDVSPRKSTTKPSIVCLDSPKKRSVGRPRKIISDAAQISPIAIRQVFVDSSASSAREEARQKFLAASPTRVALRSSQGGLHDILPSTALSPPSKSRNGLSKSEPAPNRVSPSRPRGRPRRSPSPGDLPVPSQLRKLPSSPSTPSKHVAITEPSSDYLDIDAISDIDIATHAPSPPRRTPTSPPKATLEFDRPPPPPLPAIAASTARCSAKQILAEWPGIAPTLFPKITRTVRSTPPSQDHKNPTWHEKILLYDPIVLEDLTLWLNAQGSDKTHCMRDIVSSKPTLTIPVLKMKAFLNSRQHSKAESYLSSSTAEATTHETSRPSTPTEWWLARENAFDTANRIYKKLYRDSDESHYSREQDYDEDDSRSLPPLSPSSPDWNASRWFWTTEHSEMWVDHVDWIMLDLNDGIQQVSVNKTATAISSSELQLDADAKPAGPAKKPGDTQEKFENGQISQAEVKSTNAAELRRRPKLTIQIPSGIPDYYSKHGPNDYSSCKPRITSEERAEWRKNMF